MKKLRRKIIIYIILTQNLVSCSIFSSTVIPKDKFPLNNENIDKLSGKYEILSNVEIRENVTLKHSKTENNNTNLFNYISEKTINFDSIKNYSVDIKVLTKNSLLFTLIFKNDIVEQIEINGELKNNGLFYFKDKVKRCNGIPLIFGRCYIRKIRIGINEKNDLFLNTAMENSGSFLIIFSTGYRSNSTFIYQKI